VTYNVLLHLREAQVEDNRILTRGYSTRVAQVHDPAGPEERDLPVGKNYGFMWRLYTYWRLEEKDGGLCRDRGRVSEPRYPGGVCAHGQAAHREHTPQRSDAVECARKRFRLEEIIMRTLKTLEMNETILAVVIVGFAACGLAQQAETKVLARNVIGLENVKRNSSGTLTVQNGAMRFDTGATAAEVPIALSRTSWSVLVSLHTAVEKFKKGSQMGARDHYRLGCNQIRCQNFGDRP